MIRLKISESWRISLFFKELLTSIRTYNDDYGIRRDSLCAVLYRGAMKVRPMWQRHLPEKFFIIFRKNPFFLEIAVHGSV